MEDNMLEEERLISLNDGVVLRKGASLKYVKARPGKKERMENFSFYLDSIIGKPFGSTYEVQRNQLFETNPLNFENDEADFDKDEQTRDNREILDNSDSQKLSKEDIMKLKEGGTDSQEIIEKIVESSSTFKDKTSYSQAKYLKKKKKKHLAYFITYKPTARLLSQLYFTKAASKILEIRPDTLAQILAWSNIHFGSNVLVSETCQGMVIGSILERIGEEGQIVQAYNGNCPVRIILDQFSFKEERKAIQICGFSFESIEEIKDELDGKCFAQSEKEHLEFSAGESNAKKENSNIIISNSNNSLSNELKDCNDKFVNEIMNPSLAEDSVDKDNDMADESDTLLSQDDESIPCNKRYTKEKRIEEEIRAKEYLKSKNLDALIIATKFHPLAILLELIEFIKPSSPIVVYCQYKEPLMECYRYLRDASLAINVNLTETWLRELQVLPNRTHPGITMSARSGYLLRALKIQTPDIKETHDCEPKKKFLKHD